MDPLAPVDVYLFEKHDRVTGTVCRSDRPATLEGIARLGGVALTDTRTQEKSRHVNAQGFIDLAPPFFPTDYVVRRNLKQMFLVTGPGRNAPFESGSWFQSRTDAETYAMELAKPTRGAVWFMPHTEAAELVVSFHNGVAGN